MIALVRRSVVPRLCLKACLPLLLSHPLIACGSDQPTSPVAAAGSSNGGAANASGGSGIAGASANSGAAGTVGDAAGTGPGGTSSSSGSGGQGTGGGAAGSTSASGGAAGTSTGAGGASGASGASGAGGAGAHVGFYVDGRHLYDRCGEKVVLRGVNEMIIYTASQDGSSIFSEIAKSGANSVRITWNTTGAAAMLEASIKNSIGAQLIPMVVLNDATGDLSKLDAEVDYWVRSDVVSILKKYEDKLLVNIGNEVGNGSVAQAAFADAYKGAVSRMRSAGIHTPLIIDGSSWGQDIDMLQATGPGLLSADPDHNLVFSVHMYWNDPDGTRVTTEIGQSVTANLPLIVGEFAQHAVADCSKAPFAYKTLLSVAKTSEIGYLPWSWGAVKNSDCSADQPFDMSLDGTFAGLQGWGKEVAVSDPNSIMNTSVRPHYMVAGSCK